MGLFQTNLLITNMKLSIRALRALSVSRSILGFESNSTSPREGHFWTGCLLGHFDGVLGVQFCGAGHRCNFGGGVHGCNSGSVVCSTARHLVSALGAHGWAFCFGAYRRYLRALHSAHLFGGGLGGGFGGWRDVLDQLHSPSGRGHCAYCCAGR